MILFESTATGVNKAEDTTATSSAANTPSSHILGYVQNVNTEMVRLEKISPPPLQGHDTIFDQQQQSNNARSSIVVQEKESFNISAGNLFNRIIHNKNVSKHFLLYFPFTQLFFLLFNDLVKSKTSPENF